ncbi:MAG: RelA/SpoT family protein [Draconibacterium sp.]|nr:MAG: RelA/SpoT family protein [Draconibacterium sp.]
MDQKEKIFARFQHLKEMCLFNWSQKDVEKVEKAFQFSWDILEEKAYKTGEPFLARSLDVATIITQEIGLGTDSIMSAILQSLNDAAREENAKFTQIEMLFGNPVFSILNGLAKITALDTETVDLHSENYRKLLLALAGDVRVIIIKIAERLQILRNLGLYYEENKRKLVIETTHLYAPLAHRLGLYAVNSELLDLCLKYEKPEAYNYVVNRLKETEKERAGFVAEFVKPVEKKLKQRGMQFSMKARTKSISSIFNKMNKKSVSFDEVMDLFAIRIILDSVPENEKSDCWVAYSIVTEEYQTNPNRLRDWITIPKSNGYESLHTTVLGPQGKWVEIQIRTRRMDEVAEKGLAAHWKYKGGSSNVGYDGWLMEIRNILENPELNLADFIDHFSTDVYNDEIFVFTPKGDLRKLPKGATLLDFAYEIHSKLGDSCVGGKVNGKKVTLKHKLKNGDQIEIETASHQRPKLDWLEFLVTSKAKSKVKSSLNEARKNQAAEGREILLRKFKNWKIDLNDDAIRQLLKKYEFKLAADLYCDVAAGKIDPIDIKSTFTGKAEVTVKERVEELLPKDGSSDLAFAADDDFLLIDNNLNNINYKLARCCNPVFGDPIYGFVTINDGIKIHRNNCPNARQMKERFPYRLIKAKWRSDANRSSFLTTLFVSGVDAQGVLTDITHVIAKDGGTQIRSVNINSNMGKFEGEIKLLVYNLEHLDFVVKKLKKVKGVVTVTRGEK